MGPSEMGFGSHETVEATNREAKLHSYIDSTSRAEPSLLWVEGGELDHFRVVNAPGFETRCKTLVPLRGVFEGYVVRHDESFTINRFLSRGTYAPSVYYVYEPSHLTCDSVEELRERGTRPERWRLMTSEIERGRDEVGLSIFCRDGYGIWIGSELDIEEARALFDHTMDKYVNATILQVMGGYLSGI